MPHGPANALTDCRDDCGILALLRSNLKALARCMHTPKEGNSVSRIDVATDTQLIIL